MEQTTNAKLEAASYVAYTYIGGILHLYLQMRTMDAPRAPGMIGMFGGAFDAGETPEECMIRETREELCYTPVKASYFSRYESKHDICHVFIERVDEEFEKAVTVCEGQYGKFYSLEESQHLPEIVPWVRFMVLQIADSI